MKIQRVDIILGSKPEEWSREQSLLANLSLLIAQTFNALTFKI